MLRHYYQSFIDTITACALECKYCEDLCTETLPEVAELLRDCADLCWICAAALMNRGDDFIVAICHASVQLCQAVAQACWQLQAEDEQYEKCAIACEKMIVEYHEIFNLTFFAKAAEKTKPKTELERSPLSVGGNVNLLRFSGSVAHSPRQKQSS